MLGSILLLKWLDSCFTDQPGITSMQCFHTLFKSCSGDPNWTQILCYFTCTPSVCSFVSLGGLAHVVSEFGKKGSVSDRYTLSFFMIYIRCFVC
ncbi:hypothetical protein M6B38_142945 [Iris pallida]|uniref:Uncharacterized protein n=1 Tax=Iris pallida TaxID=29817 RepID=A0AAX6FBA4_IRIPA|nr:hypothetical protein M6B38_142945 [Iris pallida]